MRGDRPVTVGQYWQLPDHGEHWWKIVSLRWGSDGGPGVAELEL